MDRQRRFWTTMAIDPPIKERAGWLIERPILWQTLRRLLYPLLKYDDAIGLADSVADLSGFEAFSLVSRKLGMRTHVEGIGNVPGEGFVFIVANHPTGIADGIAVFDALSPVRPDLRFLANRDAIRVTDDLADIIIPVTGGRRSGPQPRPERRSRV